MSLAAAVDLIAERLTRAPRHWNGRDAILEMRRAGFGHWKQTEWIGWYFQYLCSSLLASVMQIPGPSFGHPQFDGLLLIPWDFKSHAINKSRHEVIVNDSEAVASAISVYGSVGLILASGEASYNDRARTFRDWHEGLKGGPSEYTENRIARGAWSRRYKVAFALREIALIQITDATLVKCGTFQKDFRNADGSPRRGKVLLKLKALDEEIIKTLTF
jgi:hypothetical protein